MLLEISPIYPQVDYPSGWLVAAAVLCGLGLITIAIVLWRWCSPISASTDFSDSLLEHRRVTLAQISRAAEQLEPRLACQKISQLTRRFVGLASDGDADYASTAQLEQDALTDPRLEPLAQFVRDAQNSCFNPACHPDVSVVAAAAAEVVNQWR